MMPKLSHNKSVHPELRVARLFEIHIVRCGPVTSFVDDRMIRWM